MSDEATEGRFITDQEKFRIFKVALEKLHEFDMRDLDADAAAWEGRDVFQRLYATLAWEKRIDYQFAARQAFEDRYSGRAGEVRLVAELRGEQLGLPASTLPDDVALRRARYRSLAAKRLEAEIDEAINTHGITSPIEQIFLMEWKFQEGVQHQGLRLQPQFPIETADRKYVADFRVTRPGTNLSFCIELDGHEFHEKTPQQAASDKQRDRTLLGLGHQTVRFTGAEIVRDTAACVREVLRLVDVALRP